MAETGRHARTLLARHTRGRMAAAMEDRHGDADISAGPTGRPWRARRGNTAPTRMPVHGRRVVPQTAVIPVVARRLYALAAELRHAVAERSQATNGPVSRRRCRSITATHL
jgi:hypothetical protein